MWSLDCVGMVAGLCGCGWSILWVWLLYSVGVTTILYECSLVCHAVLRCPLLQGYTMKNAFIATQGPLPDTIADFWRMVWEYKCHTVIMLTKEKESGRVRCHKYWPDGNDMYGQLQVVQLTETPYSEYVLREFKLIDTKVHWAGI